MRISSLRWGVIWIGVGLFFLAVNFEVMDSLVFPRLYSLWPVLLIAIGVELIFRRTKLYFLALLSPILIAAAFILAASHHSGLTWNFDDFFRGWSWNYEGEKTNEVDYPFEAGVDTLDIDIDCGEIDFIIKSNSEKMFSARSGFLDSSPRISRHTDGGTMYISYDYIDRSRFSIFRLTGPDLKARFAISEKIPVRATLKTESDRPEIDFSDIRLSRLNLFVRSTDTMIRLGDRESAVNIEIGGKTDRLHIEAPERIGIEVRGGIEKLGPMLLDNGFVKYADGYRSGNFSKSGKTISVQVDARVASFSVTRN
jgi:hypothetical protein